jgi:hypothetical protein
MAMPESYKIIESDWRLFAAVHEAEIGPEQPRRSPTAEAAFGAKAAAP